MQTNASTVTKRDGKTNPQRAERGTVKKTTAGAMATAVSSGDDLTDFQSQPRSGQRLVSTAGGRGRGVSVQFGLSLLCGRCWLLLLLLLRCLGHFAADIYIYFYFIFIFTLSYMFACLSVCLPAPRALFPSLSHCSVCLQRQLLPAEAASQRSRQPLRLLQRGAGCGTWGARRAQGVTSAMHFLAELK